MSEIDWTSWIPDGTILCYRLKGTDEWQTGKVIDDRKYHRTGGTYHVVMLETKESITFSVTQSWTNGSEGEYELKF